MHNIEHYTYDENVNKQKVEAELNAYVRTQTMPEGGNGLYRHILWFDHTCDSYEDAKSFISKNDDGDYAHLAVKYRQLKDGVSSKRMESLQKRYREVFALYRTENDKVAAHDLKAKLITCKHCGSKLNRDYLQSNYCPLCRLDMRSDTVRTRINKLQQQVNAIEGQLNEEKRRLALKQGTIHWLVKIEYHT